MPFPIMAAYAAVAVAGGVAKYMDGKKKKKWANKREAQAAQAAEERLQKMDSLSEEAAGFRKQDMQRFDQLYAPSEQRVAAQLTEGINVEQQAQAAGDSFTNQYDASLDAANRQMLRQGVRPGSSASAQMQGDAAFNRARGAASEMNVARRAADDQNFTRNLAFSQQGQAIRQGMTNNIYREYGMQGEIRGQYKGEQAQQQFKADQASQQMSQGASQAVQGAMSYYTDPNGQSLMTAQQRTQFAQDNPGAVNETAIDYWQRQ